MATMNFTMWIKNNRVLFYSLVFSLLFLLICRIDIALETGFTLYLNLYAVGLFYGLAISIGLRLKPLPFMLLTILSTAEYIGIVMYGLEGFNLILFRRITFGGVGALAILASTHLLSPVKFTVSDYVLGFVAGIVTSVFIWDISLQFKNIWFCLMAIILWQTAISYFINGKKKLKMQATATT